MIEIFRKDGKWIATFQGGIIEFDEDLEYLLKILSRRADDLVDELNNLSHKG